MTNTTNGNLHGRQLVVSSMTSTPPSQKLSQEKIRAAIDLQPKIMEAFIAADGGHTNYMSCGSAS